MKKPQRTILFALCLISIGCFGSNEELPELTPVTGKVTLNDKPLEGAQVLFQPVDGRVSTGRTDKEGNYEIYFKTGIKGAVAGKHVVKISVEEKMNLPAGEKQIRIPAKYNSHSILNVTLSGTEPTTHNFDLVNSTR